MDVSTFNYCFLDLEVYTNQLDFYTIREKVKITPAHPYPERYLPYTQKRPQFDIRDFHALVTDPNFAEVTRFTDINVFLDYLIADERLYTLNLVSYNQIDIWVVLYQLYHFRHVTTDIDRLNIRDVFYKSVVLNPKCKWFNLSDFHQFTSPETPKDYYHNWHKAKFDVQLLFDVFKWVFSNHPLLITHYKF